MSMRGFTLIEAIVTIVILSIMGFMAAQLLSTTLRGTAESTAQVTDLANATSAMEQIAAAINTETLLAAEADTRVKAVGTAARKLTVSASASAAAFSGNTILVTVTSGAVELSRVF